MWVTFDLGLTSCISFFGDLNFGGHIRISKVPSDKNYPWVEPVRPSCAKLAEVKVFFVSISTARMVVQTCHVAFWNQCVKLHLTMRSKKVKGQNPNKICSFWETWGKEKSLSIFWYMTELRVLNRGNQLPLQSDTRFSSYKGSIRGQKLVFCK